MKIMTSRFAGVCRETGKAIKKGESIYYDDRQRAAFCSDSEAYKNFQAQNSDDGRLVSAQEDAYFDNTWDRIR